MSKILDSVHENAKRLHLAGYIDAATMHEFDELCLKGSDLEAKRKAREGGK